MLSITALEHVFRHIAEIRPEVDSDGKVVEYMPQSRYAAAKCARLHRYGQGPFCKFKIQVSNGLAGVYVINVMGNIKYVGECENLKQRFNNQYGNISPRNCFVRGQVTNCKINNLILRETQNGHQVDLWFLETPDRKRIEKELLLRIKPDWNSSL